MEQTETPLNTGYAEAGGHWIHFVECGRGEPLLLLHGAFGSGTDILQRDLGRKLAARYRVVAPDSLGHGRSDAPVESGHYTAKRRAAHLAAVLDVLAIERAHIVGYSMGGWMASAFATYYPDRVATLAIGGWDVVGGMYTPAAIWGVAEITGPYLIALVREVNPEIAAWVGKTEETSLASAIEGMNDLDGLAEGVARVPAPVAFWMGCDDLYYAASRKFAASHGITFIDLPGDHIAAFEIHGASAGERIADFIASAKRAGEMK
ncbi:alpha/beta fold hydrolase [Sphingosinicella sp.]|uniref:alpha/beta fold hydrolase n=1 Tax=Sphingosinicella sp. TaxID=1917971 RepID=UPI0017F2510E|nr:alpha/beta fold hydrolase [Sphingosinicella sp.]MBA4759301.1 alpha/beta fold hydrolase [Sphingosinicella sp.]